MITQESVTDGRRYYYIPHRYRGGGGVKIGSWNVIVLENLELECHCLRKVGSWIVIVL